jgi:hypothetical protein
MVDREGDTLNQIFEQLATWNQVLENLLPPPSELPRLPNPEL